MSSRAVIILVFSVLLWHCCPLVTTAPVLLWGVNGTSKPALIPVEQHVFGELMEPLLKDFMIVAFLEPNLTTMDLRCVRPESKESCYEYLQSAAPLTYYVNVQQPIEALRAVGANTVETVVNGTGHTVLPIACSIGNVNIVRFNVNATMNENAMPRSITLAAHDKAIELFSAKRRNCSIAYLYMSDLPPPTNMERRLKRDDGTMEPKADTDEADDTNDTDDTISDIPSDIATHYFNISEGDRVLIVSNNFMIYYKSAQVSIDGNIRTMIMEKVEVTADDTTIQLALESTVGDIWGISLDIAKGYFVVKNFFYNDTNFAAPYVEMPFKFSYCCGRVVLISKEITLIWTDLQMQGRIDKAALSNDEIKYFQFNEAWHCVGFFTPVIISGLFVVGMLVSILCCGICWIMDIGANDRFEDPTARPFQIHGYN